MMPFAMVGGGMIPLIAMPPWLVKVSVVSPFKWAITAVEGAVWRGFDAGEMLLPCAVLVAIGAVFFTLGVAIFGRIDG
jgi:ABC-2 type transport system permease protein